MDLALYSCNLQLVSKIFICQSVLHDIDKFISDKHLPLFHSYVLLILKLSSPIFQYRTETYKKMLVVTGV